MKFNLRAVIIAGINWFYMSVLFDFINPSLIPAILMEGMLWIGVLFLARLMQPECTQFINHEAVAVLASSTLLFFVYFWIAKFFVQLIHNLFFPATPLLELASERGLFGTLHIFFNIVGLLAFGFLVPSEKCLKYINK